MERASGSRSRGGLWRRRLAVATVLALIGCSTGRGGGAAARSPSGDDTATVGARAPGAVRRDDEHRRRYGEQMIVVYADPSLELEVWALFDYLAMLADQGAVFRDGHPISFGWTTIWLQAQRRPDGATELVAEEPVYEESDPENERRPDLTATLRVLEAQRQVLANTGAKAQSIDFDQHLLVVRGSVAAPKVFLMRVASPGGRMTGWRLAPVDVKVGEFEVDSIPVHQLVRERPALLSAMVLPEGYVAYFDGDEVEAVLDDSDTLVWQRDATASGEGNVTDTDPEPADAGDRDGPSPSPGLSPSSVPAPPEGAADTQGDAPNIPTPYDFDGRPPSAPDASP